MWWHTRRNQISSFGKTDESIWITRGGRRQFRRLLAAEVCATAVVMLDTPCSEVVWRVLATHSIRQCPIHFPSRASPCAITFQLEYTKILDFEINLFQLSRPSSAFHPNTDFVFSNFFFRKLCGLWDLDTVFTWFPCVYKQMLRWFPRFQVATTCFSCSSPDLNLVVTDFMFCLHVK